MLWRVRIYWIGALWSSCQVRLSMNLGLIAQVWDWRGWHRQNVHRSIKLISPGIRVYHCNEKVDIDLCRWTNLAVFLPKGGGGRVVAYFALLPTKNCFALHRAYTAYVRPVVELCTIVVVFSPQKKKGIELLDKVQNNFTRKTIIRYKGFFYYYFCFQTLKFETGFWISILLVHIEL